MDLKELRNQIDAVDQKIADLFNERQKLSKEIAKIKKEKNLPTQDLAREEEVMKNAEERCGIYGRELFQTLMDLSKKEQAKIKL